MLRILIADDHLLIRVGLRKLLEERFAGAQVVEAQNGREAVELALQEKFDVVIMDLAMPKKNGFEALKDIKYAKPKLPVLILSMHPEDEVAIRLLKAGASGFINKETAAEELTSAIKRVIAGSKYISASLAERLASSIAEGAPEERHALLSDREYQVLCMLGTGSTVGEIAKALTLSVKTVSTYRSRILQKLDLTTTAQLVRYVIERKLTPLR